MHNCECVRQKKATLNSVRSVACSLRTLTFMFIVWSISRRVSLTVCLSFSLTNCRRSIKFSRGINANDDDDDNVAADDDVDATLNYTHLSGMAWWRPKIAGNIFWQESQRGADWADKCHSQMEASQIEIESQWPAKLQVPQNAPIIAMQ